MGRRRDKRHRKDEGSAPALEKAAAPEVIPRMGIPEPEDVVPGMAEDMMAHMRALRDESRPVVEEDLRHEKDPRAPAEFEPPPSTKVVSEVDIVGAEDGLQAPPPTTVMPDVPSLPPLPPPTTPVAQVLAPVLTRERAMMQVEQIASGYLAVRAEDALHIPEYRRELVALFETAFEQEWLMVCLQILRVDPSLRMGRAVRLFGCAYAREQIKVCTALLTLDGWSFEGESKEYDALARWYSHTEQPEYVGMLMHKDGLTAGTREAVKANLKLGGAIADAVDTLAQARSGRLGWHTFFRMAGERPFEIRARIGGHFLDRILERLTGRNVMPEPFHIPQARRNKPVAE